MSEPDRIIHSRLDSAEAAVLVAELGAEYEARYSDYEWFDEPAGAPEEIDLFPPFLFTPPYGDLLLIQRGGQSIAGGAFIYLDEETAEIKRVWTSSQHRRQGLSRKIMAALEDEIAHRGYRRIYLTTGPRQPEARQLYLKLGYTPLFDLAADPEEIAHLAFEKKITSLRDRVAVTDPALAARQLAALEETYRWRPRPEVRLPDLD